MIILDIYPLDSLNECASHNQDVAISIQNPRTIKIYIQKQKREEKRTSSANVKIFRWSTPPNWASTFKYSSSRAYWTTNFWSIQQALQKSLEKCSVLLLSNKHIFVWTLCYQLIVCSFLFPMIYRKSLLFIHKRNDTWRKRNTITMYLPLLLWFY